MARNELSPNAQAAAVKVLLEEQPDLTLDAVAKKYRQLKQGVAQLRGAPKPARSGATRPIKAALPRGLR